MDGLVIAQASVPGQTQASTPGQTQASTPAQVQTQQPASGQVIPLGGAWLVIIGALIPLIGNIVNQVIISLKEQRQWKNQQAAEEQAWIRSEKAKEKEYLREIYQNCLHSLSAFNSLDPKESGSRQKRMKLVDEVCKWGAKLQLRHNSQNLNTLLNFFANHPEVYLNDVQNEIIDLLEREEEFFLNGLSHKTRETVQTPTDPSIREITISINKSFIRLNSKKLLSLSSSTP